MSHSSQAMNMDPEPVPPPNQQQGSAAPAPAPAGGSKNSNEQWQGLEEPIDDPEEMKVLCCALDSFLQYSKVAHFNATHLRRQSFYSLPRAHWELLAAPPFNYLDTLTAVDNVIDSNAEFARAIARSGLVSFHIAADGNSKASSGHQEGQNEPKLPEEWQGVACNADVDKARSTIRQFYRDWTAEGAAEREASYGPVKRVLVEEREVRRRERARRKDRRLNNHNNGHGDNTAINESSTQKEGDGDDVDPDNPHLNILIPGAGLGRLVFDLCALGFDVEGNEISYHQLLASSYILNCVKGREQHTIYPWVHGFSNHKNRGNQLRGYKVPDVHPAEEFRRLGRGRGWPRGEGRGGGGGDGGDAAGATGLTSYAGGGGSVVSGGASLLSTNTDSTAVGSTSLSYGSSIKESTTQDHHTKTTHTYTPGTMTMSASDFLCLYSSPSYSSTYDAVATVFFLDTAPNLIRYITTIRSCLRPGGLLVNLGPLLWHFENDAPGSHGDDRDDSHPGSVGNGSDSGNNSGDSGGGGGSGLGDGWDKDTAGGIAEPGSFELTDEEVVALVEKLGFRIETREQGVEAPYIVDGESMLRTVYKASFWVARKVGE